MEKPSDGQKPHHPERGADHSEHPHPAKSGPGDRASSESVDQPRLFFHRFDPGVTPPNGPHFELTELEPVNAENPVNKGNSDQGDRDHGDQPTKETPDEKTPDELAAQPSGESSQPSSSQLRDSSIRVLVQSTASSPVKYTGPPPIEIEDSLVDSRRDVAIEINQKRYRNSAATAFQQGLVMLVTVLAVLAAAWFVVPGIVERIRYAQYRGQLRAEFEVASQGLKDVSLDSLSQAYQMVNAAVGPSVVHIDIRRAAHHKIVHENMTGAPAILISDQGSGVVVDEDGYILTNRHVIADSDEILVTLSDGRRLDGIVVGTDELTDLAVLKVNANDLLPIPWGDSERIRVGSPVWAIGSPFGLDRTVTFGILSGKHRVVRAKDRYQDFMQSDVAVNPGNSGGPLVDSRGTMIGVNTAIVGDTYQGVSFAIPSTVAKKIYLQLREHGKIERGWLGVSLAEVPDQKLSGENLRVRGAQIAAIADVQSGAAVAGLQPGDVVTWVDGQAIRDVDHLMQLIGNAMAGTRIRLLVQRSGEEMNFEVKLGRRPPELDRR
ncbi:S1C family serine protease [Roseiconus lacunae]|uniref:S1C family serine protease n=1 Tax=Roseiconus lacunae TaxID=2605694 RepID=UPI001E4EAFE6|nr:trypsin-like peptidase domain-containing protein [Roseiconus lacunae]MCD0458493.1 trypsin-like peptidase domain-containing protein [Roseiconus lacunae]